jgi:hypothetical protein
MKKNNQYEYDRLLITLLGLTQALRKQERSWLLGGYRNQAF